VALDVPDAQARAGGRCFWRRLFFIPESPRYLIGKGRHAEASKVLTDLFGAEEAAVKLAEIRASFSEDHRPRLADVLAPAGTKSLLGMRPIVWVGIMLATFQQFVGINMIFYYGATLVAARRDSPKKIRCSSATSSRALVSIAAVLAALAVIDKIGRKPLLLIGSAGMAVTLGVMAWACQWAPWKTRRAIWCSAKRRVTSRWWPPISMSSSSTVSWGPGDVGHAWRDVPQPDARLGAGGRGSLRSGSQTILVVAELPGDGGRDRPCRDLFSFYAVCGGDQHLSWSSKFIAETKGKELEEMEG
jgi:SP family sugar:H+ symporter-like MFS transporter